jgi:hypothetical protein
MFIAFDSSVSGRFGVARVRPGRPDAGFNKGGITRFKGAKSRENCQPKQPFRGLFRFT